jgi:hypothetical protein
MDYGSDVLQYYERYFARSVLNPQERGGGEREKERERI